MHPTKLLVAIVTVLALSASLANAASHKGKGYNVQKTSATSRINSALDIDRLASNKQIRPERAMVLRPVLAW